MREKERRVKAIKLNIKRQSYLKDRSTLRSRVTRCKKTGKMIIVHNKPCPCSQANVSKWTAKINKENVQLRKIRREKRVIVQNTKKLWEGRTKICEKTGKKVIIVQNKPCPCSKVSSRLRKWTNKERIGKLSDKARVYRNRVARCAKTGKIITVQSKPCPCSQKNKVEWFHKLKVERRRVQRIESRVKVQRIQEKAKVYKNRLTTCKKTGQVIIAEKPCPCTADRMKKWNTTVEKSTISAIKVKREQAKKQTKDLDRRYNSWRKVKSSCSGKTKVVEVRMKPCPCSKVRTNLRRIDIRRRSVKEKVQSLKLKDRLVKCNKTGKIIKIAPKKTCACTKTKVDRWAKQRSDLVERQRSNRRKFQTIDIRNNRNTLVKIGSRVEKCAKTGKPYIVVQNKKCSCEKNKKLYSTVLAKVNRVEKRRIRQTQEVIQRTEKTIQKRCSSTGRIIVKALEPKCNCKKLKEKVTVYKTKVTSETAARQSRLYNNRITRCKRTGKIIITVKDVKKPCKCSSLEVNSWREKAKKAERVQSDLRAQKKTEVIKKVETLKIQVKRCKKTGAIIINKKNCKCSSLRKKLIVAKDAENKERVKSITRVYTSRIKRCAKTNKPITITVKGHKKKCDCTKSKISHWNTEVRYGRNKSRDLSNKIKLIKTKSSLMKYHNRVKICKKTGQVIIEKKPCKCTKKRVDRWIQTELVMTRRIRVYTRRDDEAKSSIASIELDRLTDSFDYRCSDRNSQDPRCIDLRKSIAVQKRKVEWYTTQADLLKTESDLVNKIEEDESQIDELKQRLSVSNSDKDKAEIKDNISELVQKEENEIKAQRIIRVRLNAQFEKSISEKDSEIKNLGTLIEKASQSSSGQIVENGVTLDKEELETAQEEAKIATQIIETAEYTSNSEKKSGEKITEEVVKKIEESVSKVDEAEDDFKETGVTKFLSGEGSEEAPLPSEITETTETTETTEEAPVSSETTETTKTTEEAPVSSETTKTTEEAPVSSETTKATEEAPKSSETTETATASE